MGDITKDKYWTKIDVTDVTDDMITVTYEHRMPHGTLVRVATKWNDGVAEAIAFVPATGTEGSYR